MIRFNPHPAPQQFQAGAHKPAALSATGQPDSP
jgi:hypothetical protein